MLRRFVEEHTTTSVGEVLGFADANPSHADAVERWLSSRDGRAAPRHDLLVQEGGLRDRGTSVTDQMACESVGEAVVNEEVVSRG
jgi:hypothetical protein